MLPKEEFINISCVKLGDLIRYTPYTPLLLVVKIDLINLNVIKVKFASGSDKHLSTANNFFRYSPNIHK